jgi:gametolysin peptidase M11/fibronectin type III domain protein
VRRRLPIPPLAVLAAAVLAPGAFGHGGGTQTVEGTLRGWHGDTFAHPVGTGVGVDTGVAGVVPVDARPESVGDLLGRRVRAQGTRSGNVLALSGGLQPAGATTVAAATGTRTVAVLLFNFSNDVRQPWTTSTVRGVVFDNTDSVRAYYLDASYGQLSMTGDAFGWYTIDATNAGCDYTTWATQARAKATAAGVPLGSYQYTVYAFPQAASCGWAGLAYLPGTGSWINGAMSLRVVGHELGHNFGVHHASTLACSSGALSGSCSASEYGDPFSIMGSATKRHHNNWHRAQLGWASDIVTTSSGIVTLTPTELGGSPRLVRVPRGDGTYLNLEFRQPAGPFDDFAASDPVVNGVSVRVAPDLGSLVQSKLIDGTPGSPGGFADAALGAGASFTDPLSGITITVVSVSPAGASVSIQSTPDTQAPTQPGSLQAATQSSSAIALQWTASTDDRGVTGYRVYRNGGLVTTTTSLTFTDTGLAPATTYAYDVRAVDAAGNASQPATASATTATGDVQAPTAPGTLAATTSKGRRVDLSWGPASDDVGVVGYRVYRGGAQVAQVTTRTFRDRPPRGTYTYTVRAIDAAGNLGAPSNGVVVTVS